MSRWPVSRRCIAGAAWVLAASAMADESAFDVRVGVGGGYRAGSWTPLVVSGPRPGDVLHAAVQDPDGEFVRSPPARVDGTAARMHVRFGRPLGRVRIENATTGAAATVDLPQPLPSTAEVWLLLGDLPALGRAARLLPRADGARPVILRGGTNVGHMAGGGTASDVDGIDTVVACGRALGAVDADLLGGIDAWIRDGGRLVLAAGTSALALAAGGGPAAEWLPGPVAEVVPLRRVAAIEAHARAPGLAARPTAAGLRVPLLANRRSLTGNVDVFEGNAVTDLPLVVRRAHGLGSIVWVGLDLDDEPFRGWAGTDTFLVRLLGGRAAEPDGPRPGAVSGPPDLAGQLRLALEAPGPDGGIAPVPFALIAGLGLLYAVSIFPLEWWIVSRSGRPWLAWLTLPALVAAFTAAAWSVSGRWRPAAASEARAAEIIDVDVADGRVRGRSWLAVWSRHNTTLGVAVARQTETLADGAAISWFADAGPGFGAIDATVPHPTLAGIDYAYGETLAALTGVPVAAVSSRLFEARWSGTAAAAASADLVRDGQGTLRGSFAHHLPFTLVGCRLAHGGWLYDVGDLAPGERHDLASGRGPRSLAGALARREAATERGSVSRWNPAGTDLARILEVAGFHAAAGGAAYTGLDSGRLARLDLSPILPLDRAVLIGTAAAPPPAWTTPWRVAAAPAAAPRVTRMYRIVIPLGAAAQASRAAGGVAE